MTEFDISEIVGYSFNNNYGKWYSLSGAYTIACHANITALEIKFVMFNEHFLKHSVDYIGSSAFKIPPMNDIQLIAKNLIIPYVVSLQVKTDRRVYNPSLHVYDSVVGPTNYRNANIKFENCIIKKV